MEKTSEKLAESLEALHVLQAEGTVAIRSNSLSRTHRERLLRNGFLKEVIKGWYVPTRPDEAADESTAWYAAFWPFCANYLRHLKGDEWCLSPEQSLSIHTENWTVPRQLLVRAAKARNNITALPANTSLLDIRAALPESTDTVEKNGLRLFSLPAALIACAPSYFSRNPTDTRAALSMIRDASEVLGRLLEGGHSTIAGRLAGAFRNVGRTQIADDITNTMRAAGYDIRENDPFKTTMSLNLSTREQSAYVNRIRLLWRDMREQIIERFPKAPGQPTDIEGYLQFVEDLYVSDAYHSLSIEGYRVSTELIERVRSGNWNPEDNENDLGHLNALAARGYWQAYQAVRRSIDKVLKGNNPGAVTDDDHRMWYREMFTPGVTAGLLRATDLAGYRNGPVYIRGSMHIPPSREGVRDAMPAFFDLLRDETDPAVRVVLGHFMFVYIHPYTDGNGRMGRFLMNVMLASGGYPWTVVPLKCRHDYMDALEQASVNHDIIPFTDCLARLVNDGLNGTADIQPHE